MCNLYRMTRPASEVAALFAANETAQGANLGEDIYPGTPGLVVADGTVRAMVWGFPLVLHGKQGQPLKPKPVNNARADKLGSGFWRQSFAARRCLIPLDQWAEAEGPRGRMTRTWLSVPGSPLVAAAGLWRDSAEWGAAYAMVMTDSAGSAAATVHSRMPVLIAPQDHARWLTAAPQDALTLCRAWPGTLDILRSTQLWSGRPPRVPNASGGLL